MSDYINKAQAVAQTIAEIESLEYIVSPELAERIKRDYEAQPKADVEPVRHGHWILCRLNSLHLDWRNFECSVCRMNRIRRTGEVLNYCPNCGAKMDIK